MMNLFMERIRSVSVTYHRIIFFNPIAKFVSAIENLQVFHVICDLLPDPLRTEQNSVPFREERQYYPNM